MRNLDDRNPTTRPPSRRDAPLKSNDEENLLQIRVHQVQHVRPRHGESSIRPTATAACTYSREPSSSVTVGVSASTVELDGMSRRRSSARLPTFENSPRRCAEVSQASGGAVRPRCTMQPRPAPDTANMQNAFPAVPRTEAWTTLPCPRTTNYARNESAPVSSLRLQDGDIPGHAHLLAEEGPWGDCP